MASAVGDDPRGEEALAILRSHGVDVSPIQVIPSSPTGTVRVAVDSAGKPTFTIEEEVAWDQIDWTPELEAALAAADAVYFGTLGQRSELSRQTMIRILEGAREAGTPRVLDVNLRAPFFNDELIRSSVRRAGIVKLSDEELSAVIAACGVENNHEPEASLRSLLNEYRLDLVVMTRGADGALLVSADETCDQPGVPVEVRDTVGAGDSFTASLVTGLLRGEPIPEIARKSCGLAANACMPVSSSMAGAVKVPLDFPMNCWLQNSKTRYSRSGSSPRSAKASCCSGSP